MKIRVSAVSLRRMFARQSHLTTTNVQDSAS
jgi:hypothetical protein